MDAVRAWLDMVDTVDVHCVDALDREIHELLSTTTELENLWKDLAMQTKTDYVKRALRT